MCGKHRILRILYHIPSKCGIPIFKFFQKTGHSRSSKRNTQYARPCKHRERAKQNMASRGKGAASSRGTAMRRPRSGRQVSTSESPPKRQRRYGLRSSSGLSGSHCSRSSPKGRSSPRRMGPNGSVNRLENRRRICRQPFSGSRTPMRRLSRSPTAQQKNRLCISLCTGGAACRNYFSPRCPYFQNFVKVLKMLYFNGAGHPSWVSRTHLSLPPLEVHFLINRTLRLCISLCTGGS